MTNNPADVQGKIHGNPHGTAEITVRKAQPRVSPSSGQPPRQWEVCNPPVVVVAPGVICRNDEPVHLQAQVFLRNGVAETSKPARSITKYTVPCDLKN